MRAQTSLPALGIALLLLVSTTLFAMVVAEEQLRTSGSHALERETATSVADALVAAESRLTQRANVLENDTLAGLDAAAIESTYGLESTAGIRVRLRGRTLVSRGAVDGGTTIDRIVLLEERSPRTLTPPFRASRNVTLPRRTPNATLELSPGGNATIEVVRVDGRVVLENPSGLAGTHTVPVSRYRTATLAFEGSGNLSGGDVRVSYYPARTRKATLAVTVKRFGDPDG